MRIYFILFLIGVNLWSCSPINNQEIVIDAYNYEIVKHDTFNVAAVASAHPLASEVGRQILEQGGTAVDAAIAVNYALAVVYPNAGNIGGGGFMVVSLKNGETTTFDFREQAPGFANRDMYLDSSGLPNLSKSQIGHLSAGVPGTVKGMEMVYNKLATINFKELIQPAIDLAEKGFSITEKEAMGLNINRDNFIKYNTQTPAFVKDEEWKVNDTLIQMDLANTLKRIQKDGSKGFYEGETARLIVEEMKRGGGIINNEDLLGYYAVERDPVKFNYKDYEVISMGLPSSGGMLLQQLMGMIEPYSIGQYGFQTKESINLMVEAERRAYADRAEYLGDIDFVDVPVSKLLDKDYLISRMVDFELLKAGSSLNVQAGLPEESEETTHFSIIDKDGNMVSFTTTINSSYGSRVVVGGAGFILNNGMDNFSAKPGTPNRFGLLGNEANAIAPGKRMLSSMTPTIIKKNNKPYMVVGTPGGSTIITSVFQAVVNVLEFGMSALDAVHKPRFHHQWKPDVIYIERGFDPSVRREVESLGYILEERDNIGRMEMLLIRDGVIEAVGDWRGDDSVSGY